jgi:hypothetical protein
MNACKQRQATTGSWFVRGRLFEDWKGHGNSFLWLHGIGTFSIELSAHAAHRPAQLVPGKQSYGKYIEFFWVYSHHDDPLVHKAPQQLKRSTGTLDPIPRPQLHITTSISTMQMLGHMPFCVV